MKKLKFPFNCIELFMTDYQIDTGVHNLTSLREYIDKIKIQSTSDDQLNQNKNTKIKLFYFLHDLFMDQIFLGNNFLFITDLHIHWNKEKEKFFLILNKEDNEWKLRDINGKNKIYIHSCYLNNANKYSFESNSECFGVDRFQGLFWSIGILVMKYIIDIKEDLIENFRNNSIDRIADSIEMKGINKIFLVFLKNLFEYEDKLFAKVYLMFSIIRENISDILDGNISEEKIILQLTSSSNLTLQEVNKPKKIRSNFSKNTLDSKNSITKKLANLNNLAYSFTTKSIYFSDNNLIKIEKTNSEYPFEFLSVRNKLNEEIKNSSYGLEFSLCPEDHEEKNSKIVLFSCTSTCSKCNNDIYREGHFYKDNLGKDNNDDLKNIILCEDCQVIFD